MIKCCFVTDDERGCFAIIGINKDNLKRIKAGMALKIDLDDMTPPGVDKISTVIIHYADTYEQILDEMEAGGLPITKEVRDSLLYQNAGEFGIFEDLNRKDGKVNGS